MIMVTAAIIQKENKILICRRGAGGDCAYLWEFPGGKVEPDETPEACIVRECREELGIDILLQGAFSTTTYRYPDREIAFTFYLAEITDGEVCPLVHSEVKWALPSQLGKYRFCPADVEIVERIMSRTAGP